MKKLILLLALGMLICLPGMAMADWYATDQGWYDNYPASGPPAYNVDTIDFYITTYGLNFGGNGVVDYGSPGFSGWSVITTPYKVVATNGSAPTSATWNYEFTGSPLANYILIWDGYYNGNFVVGEIDTVINGAFQFGSTGYGYYFYDTPIIPPTPTPVPPSVLLLGSGLFGLGLLGRRKIFKA
ncbi:MAG: hypothetical protein ABSA09_07870 [Desulfobaccales bacterium]|jgi:hypothetical protein